MRPRANRFCPVVVPCLPSPFVVVKSWMREILPLLEVVLCLRALVLGRYYTQTKPPIIPRDPSKDGLDIV